MHNLTNIINDMYKKGWNMLQTKYQKHKNVHGCSKGLNEREHTFVTLKQVKEKTDGHWLEI